MVQNIEQNTSKNEMNCALFETKNPEIALIVLHVHVKVTYNIVILYFEGGECVEISHWNNNVFLRIILREKIECFAITSNKTSIKKIYIYISKTMCVIADFYDDKEIEKEYDIIDEDEDYGAIYIN